MTSISSLDDWLHHAAPNGASDGEFARLLDTLEPEVAAIRRKCFRKSGVPFKTMGAAREWISAGRFSPPQEVRAALRGLRRQANGHNKRLGTKFTVGLAYLTLRIPTVSGEDIVPVKPGTDHGSLAEWADTVSAATGLDLATLYGLVLLGVTPVRRVGAIHRKEGSAVLPLTEHVVSVYQVGITFFTPSLRLRAFRSLGERLRADWADHPIEQLSPGEQIARLVDEVGGLPDFAHGEQIVWWKSRLRDCATRGIKNHWGRPYKSWEGVRGAYRRTCEGLLPERPRPVNGR